MQDNAVVEKWNPISSAEMAVGVKGVLYRVLKDKRHPFDFKDALEKGIDFLGEASDGGAIICGDTPKTNFTGTLAPFTITTRYIPGSTQGLEETEFYRRVVTTLRSYKALLDDLLNNNQEGVNKDKLQNAHEFFSAIAKIMMQEADPVLKSVSRPYS